MWQSASLASLLPIHHVDVHQAPHTAPKIPPQESGCRTTVAGLRLVAFGLNYDFEAENR